MTFTDVVRSEEDLRAVLGYPAPRAVNKEIHALDAHCRALIASSPFVLVASCNAQGAVDVSPKGDPAGFVHVLDDHTLAIPDRPGNRRADTFVNLLENPGVGLIFLIPGKLETLRVNGRGMIVRDAQLLERMAVGGKPPRLALVVTVEQAFIHCAKCMLRSGLWQPDSWPALDSLPSQAQCLVDHAKLSDPLAAVQASIDESRTSGLY
jgi:PPOX class probable FMN-dependent enzyme